LKREFLVRKFLFFFFVVLFISGCAATGPLYSIPQNVPEDETIIYVYREDSFVLGGRSAYFYINDVNVFDINKNGYSWLSLPQGVYNLRQGWPIDVLAKSLQSELNIETKEDIYLKFSTHFCESNFDTMCLGWQIEEVEAAIAKEEIKMMHYQKYFGEQKLRSKLKE
jgi:hypothetical protein